MTIQLLCAFLFSTILSLCTTIPSIRKLEGEKSLCEPCGKNCNECGYGVIFSPVCDDYQCRKGPGEVCGGREEKYGICGEGLLCHCNKCVGCSTDSLECFINNCLPRTEIQLSYPNHFHKYGLDD